jgi:hypothetical protein
MNVMFAGVSFVVYSGTVPCGANLEVGLLGKYRVQTTGMLQGIALVAGVDGDTGCMLID